MIDEIMMKTLALPGLRSWQARPELPNLLPGLQALRLHDARFTLASRRRCEPWIAQAIVTDTIIASTTKP